MGSRDHVDVCVEVIKVTDRAYLLKDVESEEEAWIPISLCDRDDLTDDDIGEELDVGIQEWKLEELGW